ncbi:MAG: HEPN domain-containing protein [Gemmatimonadales bacterium]
MAGSERIAEVVREWVEKAENDLKNAAHTVKMDEGCPTDTVCFHAQQCVEKYLKAFLVSKGIDFPNTHDIGELTALMPRRAVVQLSTEEQRRLVAYATVTGYPGDYEPVSLSEARLAVKMARRVRKNIRMLLPKNVLRRRRG